LPTCWIGEEDKELLPTLEDIGETELPLLIEPERPAGFAPFVFVGGAGLLLLDGKAELLLIGVMLPVLLGVVMPALEALLLLRGMKLVSAPAEEGETNDFPVPSSMGVGMVVLGFRVR